MLFVWNRELRVRWFGKDVKNTMFNSFFVGEQNISELLATNIAIEECEKSITLAQHIDQIAGKGEKGSSGLKSHLVIKYVDLK
jgi:hypothetical protein